MRKAVIGEWLLLLVMPPERASATIGDLTESSNHALGFWVAVAQTTVASCWMTITANPRATGELAGRVFSKYVGLQIVFTVWLLGIVIVTSIVKVGSGPTWMLWLPGALEIVGRGIWLPYVLGHWASLREPQNGVVAVTVFYA